MGSRTRRAVGLALLVGVAAAGAALDAMGADEGPVGEPAAGAVTDHVLHTMPDWVPFGGMALGRHVYLKASQQTPYGLGHELVHVRQQAAHPVWFWVSYLLLPTWRLHWEAEAYAVHARARCPIDGEHGLAAYLSGPAYLWLSTREGAAAEIRRFE